MRKAGTNIFNFYLPTRIVHGPGSIKQTGMMFKSLGATKALIVTDQGVKRAGLVNGVADALKKGNIEYAVFDEVEVDPGATTVEKGADFATEERCDGIIVVGGGSPMCAARAIAMVAANGGKLKDHVPVPKPGAKPPLPVIAIPTTAGSGSEVSQFIVLKDEELNSKIGLGSPMYFPKIAILDPNVLRKLPFWQTVVSGIDALTHAIEAYLTDVTTPITDSLALGAVDLLYKNLRQAATTDDIDAKEACLLGSTMANMACGNARLGLVHTMVFPIEGMAKIEHGVSVGTLLPHVMEFNLPASYSRFAVLARTMSESDGKMSEVEVAPSAIRAVKRLLVDLQFPRKYDKSLIDRKKIPEMTDMIMSGLYGGGLGKKKEYAMNAVLDMPNIRKATKKDVIELYEKAFEGWEI